MTLSITVSDRFRDAAADWGDNRLMDDEEALEVKAEQALLEIEHLVADATDVEFTVEGDTIHHEPSSELEAFLERQAERHGIDPEEVLEMHVNLFARAFLDDRSEAGGPSTDDPRPGR
ncbi:hypothetical protein [Halopiger xanaduensis]|uniref:Uncharacterized protein n=1 Tax=Halopiger xanaduensis (strain DSM 18323 / JCM 14033 / SH-6) TaxID=797210 RepID=F8DC99_HALXS|nr:hypothetical protein [Halopiger xanaduensis]AEH38356.1 hypothetical protein Halxa_3750 [Halopiger xanaduensis SH-6]